jgi:DNA-binding transcriptional LysR family regulator
MLDSNSNWFLRARLKTRQLLLLVALDEERNIHRAAEELNMTQPAASKQLKYLEDMMGVQLLDRLPRGMQPTRYGEAMVRHARMALASLSHAHDEVLALKSGLAGEVAVGVIMTPAMTLLPRAISRVKQELPMLRISVQMEASNVLLGQLQRGSLDFLVGRILDQESATDLQYEELSDEPICAIARVGHPLLTRPSLEMKDIASAGWILPPHGSILRNRFDMMFRRNDLEPPSNVIDTTAMLVSISLMEHTDLLQVIPIEVANYYVRHKMFSILPIDLPCKLDAFGIITRRNQLLSPGAKILLNEIREAAADIY